jgi:hypothetical protein
MQEIYTLCTNKMISKRLYSAEGNGYFEINDQGDSWKTPKEVLCHKYIFG